MLLGKASSQTFDNTTVVKYFLRLSQILEPKLTNLGVLRMINDPLFVRQCLRRGYRVVVSPVVDVAMAGLYQSLILVTK